MNCCSITEGHSGNILESNVSAGGHSSSMKVHTVRPCDGIHMIYSHISSSMGGSMHVTSRMKVYNETFTVNIWYNKT